jgi:glycerophosphoryl diester phosphodiesterase
MKENETSEHREMIATEVNESVNKLNKKGLLVDGKIVLRHDSDVTKVFKKDLINYIIHLKAVYPTMFQNHHSFNSFLKKVKKRKKVDIVDIINYYYTNRNKNVTYHVEIKGINSSKSPELVKVYVKKEVRKVVKRNAS